MDCLFRVKTITLETANVTNCHVIATDILFLSSNHRSVQFLYLAASLNCLAAILKLLQNDSQGTSVVTRMDTPKYDETLKFMYIKNQPILVVTKGLSS